MNIQKNVMESQNIDNFHNVMKEKYVNIYILSKTPNSFTGFINSSKGKDMIFNIQCGHACVYSILYRAVSFYLSVGGGMVSFCSRYEQRHSRSSVWYNT